MADKSRRVAALLAGALALFQVAPAAAQSFAETKIFGDWQRNCVDVSSCTLTQANASPGTDDIRMRTEISVVAETGILISVIVPESVLLTEGPWLTVDGVFVGAFTYVRCANGCLAQILFPDQQFRLVSGGNRGVVTVSVGGRRVGLVLSLNGLEDGLASFNDL